MGAAAPLPLPPIYSPNYRLDPPKYLLLHQASSLPVNTKALHAELDIHVACKHN